MHLLYVYPFVLYYMALCNFVFNFVILLTSLWWKKSSILTYCGSIKKKKVNTRTHAHTHMLSIEVRGQIVSHRLLFFPREFWPSAPGWRKASLVSADSAGRSQRGVKDECLCSLAPCSGTVSIQSHLATPPQHTNHCHWLLPQVLIVLNWATIWTIKTTVMPSCLHFVVFVVQVSKLEEDIVSLQASAVHGCHFIKHW